ncbi:MAG: GDP-L-fucose synthase [Candidatus Azobacteroides sp.]|nr:GDP-L-fucose synthase [Candidatus Azobacteroides sp.]
MIDKNAKIYIAGHAGMVGSAIYRNLQGKGYANIITRDYPELDLINQAEVEAFFAGEKPEYVVLAAAKVGGIVANNTYRAQFIYENLMIQNNIIHASYKNGVKKLLFLGSSCIYPRLAPQPIKEEYLLTGELEPTNEPYAIAKIAGIKMCEAYHSQYGSNFISVMPTNLYGKNDNYDLEKSHVLPALIRKMYLAKCLMADDWVAICKDLNKRPVEGVSGGNSDSEILSILSKYGISGKNVTLWGTGAPLREFLNVEDMADACVFMLQNYNAPDTFPAHVNIGFGEDLSIKELAEIVKNIVGYDGEIIWDRTKPDGTPRKLMDSSKLYSLGWKPQISLPEGISDVFKNYLEYK